MQNYATIEQLKAMTPFEFSDAEESAASEALTIASAKLRRAFRLNQVEIDEDDEDLMACLRSVCIDMVRRFMDRPEQSADDSMSMYMSAPFATQSFHPTGGRLFIRGDEYEMLGISKRPQSAFFSHVSED